MFGVVDRVNDWRDLEQTFVDVSRQRGLAPYDTC